jgi:hypothetical protein
MKLFGPAWNSIYKKRAVAAVKKIDDEATLIRIFKEARCKQARLAAFKKLVNWDILADQILFNLLQYEKSGKFLIAIVARATDPTLLARIAKEAWHAEARLAALKKVSDPTLRADIAKNGRYDDVRKAATHKAAIPFIPIQELLTKDKH